MEGEKKRSVDSETSGKERKKVKISEEDKQESSSVDKSSISEETPKNKRIMGSHSNGNTVATLDMCEFCFDVLMAHFFKKFDKPSPSFTNDSYPLFVTWKIGNKMSLRGCIGTFTSLSLHKGIKEYALTSAMNDSRFNPVSKHEISQLSVSVSLLVGFEDGTDYLDWTVGVHGIKIEFLYGRSTKTATFLPDVAKEQGWTKEETVESLLKKAGVRSQMTQALKDSIKLIRYRSEKVEMDFEEYLKRRQNVPELLNGCYVPLSNGQSSSKYSNGYRQ